MAATRLKAVERVWNGEAPSAVMQDMGLNRSSIYPWLKQYRAEGLLGLQAKATPGRTPKLNAKRQQLLQQMLKNQSPRAFGFNQDLWNTGTLTQLIKQHFKLTLGKTALSRLLTNTGLSNQRLKNRLASEQKYLEILKHAKREGAAVVFLTLAASPSFTPIISAAPPSGNLHFMLYKKHITAVQLKTFLLDLLKLYHQTLYLIIEDSPAMQEIMGKKTMEVFQKTYRHRLNIFDLKSADKQDVSDQRDDTLELFNQLTPPPLIDLEAWTLLINQSLLDIDYPFGNFLQALNIHFDCSAIIIPNIHIPTSPLRPTYAYAELKPLSLDLQKTISMNESTLKYWGTNPMVNALEKPGDLLQIDDVITRDEWSDNIFCRGQLQITGGRYFDLLALCFAGPENTLCALLLFRSPDRHYFNGEEKQFIRRLRPHLETAMAITVTTMRNSYTLTALEEATEHMAIATLVLDGEQQIIKSNGAARELLAQKNNLHEANKRLRFNDSASQKVFEKAVQKAIRWRQAPIGKKPVEAFQLRYHASYGEKNTAANSIGVLVQPITPPSFVVPHSAVVSPHVVVYISNPEKKRETPQLQLIMQLFNLSQREARLTTLITEGCSLDEAAEAMNITQATARTYLQHIYEKTGVRRRQDLVQRVLKSVALLA